MNAEPFNLWVAVKETAHLVERQAHAPWPEPYFVLPGGEIVPASRDLSKLWERGPFPR